MNTKPRVMYLDVDDTLLVWTNASPGFSAPKAAEFVLWALEHFEVRWLTMWCPSGVMSEFGAQHLSFRFNSTIAPEVFLSIHNPKSFVNNKTEGIDFTDSRPWVWVEDGMVLYERNEMDSRGTTNNFYRTNVSHNVVALQSTWKKLAERFGLPGAPTTPFTQAREFPITPMLLQQIRELRENHRLKTE